MPSDIDFWRSQYRAKWKTLRTGISYAAGASVYQQEYDPARPAYTGNWHPESWQTFLHAEYLKYISEDPFFWGIWVGNMFDYGAASRTWGEGNGINDCGLVTFDRKYRKDAYYLYKANWNKHEPFVYIAERRLDRHVDGQVIRPVDAQVAGQINRQTEQLSPGNRTFRVFTNCPEAELFVNGISFGSKTPLQGVIEWGDVPLKEGGNSIEARCGGYSDSIMVTVVGR